MAVKELQDFIKENKGYIISEATLLTSDLCQEAYRVIGIFNIRPKFRRELAYLIGDKHIEWGFSDNILDNYESELGQQASWLWNEDIFHYFNYIAPKGYYFGSHEGDGACIGWFQYDEEECF